MPRTDTDTKPLPRAFAARAFILLSSLTLAACTSAGSKPDIPECAQPQSAECATALDHIQVLRYADVPAERLIAAASRAAGDLNFDLVRRDDAAGLVLARYIGSAPTHKDQLDSRFHAALKDEAALPVLARITIGAPATAGATPVRVQLLLPAEGQDSSTATVPLGRVSPYQLFFEQLSLELDGRSAPPPGSLDDRDDKRRKKPEVLPGNPSVPTGI